MSTYPDKIREYTELHCGRIERHGINGVYHEGNALWLLNESPTCVRISPLEFQLARRLVPLVKGITFAVYFVAPLLPRCLIFRSS